MKWNDSCLELFLIPIVIYSTSTSTLQVENLNFIEVSHYVQVNKVSTTFSTQKSITYAPKTERQRKTNTDCFICLYLIYLNKFI